GGLFEHYGPNMESSNQADTTISCKKLRLLMKLNREKIGDVAKSPLRPKKPLDAWQRHLDGNSTDNSLRFQEKELTRQLTEALKQEM
ncbi:unnamed protein product, partial [Ilex paraguariensis]